MSGIYIAGQDVENLENFKFLEMGCLDQDWMPEKNNFGISYFWNTEKICV